MPCYLALPVKMARYELEHLCPDMCFSSNIKEFFLLLMYTLLNGSQHLIVVSLLERMSLCLSCTASDSWLAQEVLTCTSLCFLLGGGVPFPFYICLTYLWLSIYHHQRRKPRLKDRLYQTGLWVYLWVTVLIVSLYEKSQPTAGSTILWAGGPWWRKLANYESVSQSGRGFPPWILI